MFRSTALRIIPANHDPSFPGASVFSVCSMYAVFSARLLCLFGLLFTISGCGASYRSTQTIPYTDSLTSVPIPPDEPVFVSVSNFHGSIHVAADPSLSTIQIKRSLHAREKDFEQPGRNFDLQHNLKHSLDFIDYRARLARSADGRAMCTVIVTTSYPEPMNQWVELDIRIPNLAGVNLHTNNGEVTVANAHGPMIITNDKGDIIVSTVYPVRDRVTLITTNGHIDLRVPVSSTGSVSITAVNGRAAFSMPDNHRFAVRLPDSSHVVGILNPGANAITLQTTEGNARIIVADDPAHISPLKKLSLPVRP